MITTLSFCYYQKSSTSHFNLRPQDKCPSFFSRKCECWPITNFKSETVRYHFFETDPPSLLPRVCRGQQAGSVPLTWVIGSVIYLQRCSPSVWKIVSEYENIYIFIDFVIYLQHQVLPSVWKPISEDEITYIFIKVKFSEGWTCKVVISRRVSGPIMMKCKKCTNRQSIEPAC